VIVATINFSQTTLNSTGWVVTHPVVVSGLRLRAKQWRFGGFDAFLDFFAAGAVSGVSRMVWGAVAAPACVGVWGCGLHSGRFFLFFSRAQTKFIWQSMIVIFVPGDGRSWHFLLRLEHIRFLDSVFFVLSPLSLDVL